MEKYLRLEDLGNISSFSAVRGSKAMAGMRTTHRFDTRLPVVHDPDFYVYIRLVFIRTS